jgi:hypothetical protein
MGERLKHQQGQQEKEKRYRWVLSPGSRFFVMQSGPDIPDWYPVVVPEGHEVTVIGNKIINEGRRPVGRGVVSKIDNGSFFDGNTFVCVGLKAKVPFPKKK